MFRHKAAGRGGGPCPKCRSRFRKAARAPPHLLAWRSLTAPAHRQVRHPSPDPEAHQQARRAPPALGQQLHSKTRPRVFRCTRRGCQALPQTSRALLNTLVAALCVDRRRHAYMQVFGERVELGLLARAARGLAEATLARTGKPPHLELPEAPSFSKRVVRHDLAHQAHELHLGVHHIARNVSQHPPPERVALLVLGVHLAAGAVRPSSLNEACLPTVETTWM